MMAIMNSGGTDDWFAIVRDFLSLFAVVLVALVIVLLCVGLLFEFFNARHPERKIQKGRRNKRKRKWKEFYRPPGSLAIIAFCFFRRFVCADERLDHNALRAEQVDRPAFPGSVGLAL